MDEQPAAKQGPHLMEEADVGSGEKSPGQKDTDALIEQIGDQPGAPAKAEAAVDPDAAVAPPGVRPRPADSASAGPP